jgi:two-component system chemotaxis response regulator CheB
MLFRNLLSEGLSNYQDIEVIGAAVDPVQAKDMILQLNPDVMTLDIEMPRMDGIKFLRKLMPKYPIPVVVLSALRESVFEAMEAGATEFVSKPDSRSLESGSFLDEFVEKIRGASMSKRAFRITENVDIDMSPIGVTGPLNPDSIIAIGASTGGTEAIKSILSKFSDNMPGILVVQHMPEGFTKTYADRLNSMCRLEVKEAEDGDGVYPGRVLIAPGGLQMRVLKDERGYRVDCGNSPKVVGHRPSVDYLFESVALFGGKNAIGVILTGMGADGAVGLKKIRDFGGYTIGQDERSSVVYGMPMAAFTSGAVMLQLPLYRIADELCRKLSE